VEIPSALAYNHVGVYIMMCPWLYTLLQGVPQQTDVFSDKTSHDVPQGIHGYGTNTMSIYIHDMVDSGEFDRR